MLKSHLSLGHGKRALTLAILTAFFVTLSASAEAPSDEAVKVYRDYVAAIRAGSVDDAQKLVEPVPETSKALLRACLEGAIAIEAVKTEAIRQLGPPKPDDDGWDFGQLPDHVLDKLVGEVVNDNTVKLVSRDEQIELPIPYDLLMIRREDKWLVPASIVLGIETTVPYFEPAEGEREGLLKQAQATAKGAKVVLEKLKNKQYKTPQEVSDALIEETMRAGDGMR